MRITAASIVMAASLAACGKSERPLPTPGPITGEPVELAYHLRTGDTWKFDVEAVQQMGADEGGPRATIRYTLALRVTEGRPDGGGTVAIGFDDLKVETDPPTPSTGQLDFRGIDVAATLSRTGAIEDLRIAAPTGRSPDMYRAIITSALMPFRLADRAVRVNETWTSEEVVPTRLAGLPRALEFRSRMRAWIVGTQPDGVHIQIAGDVDLPKQTVSPDDSTIARGPVEIASAGTVVMDVVFDRARGMVSRIAGDMRSKMDVVTGDDRIVVKGDATTKMQLQPVAAAMR